MDYSKYVYLSPIFLDLFLTSFVCRGIPFPSATLARILRTSKVSMTKPHPTDLRPFPCQEVFVDGFDEMGGS